MAGVPDSLVDILKEVEREEFDRLRTQIHEFYEIWSEFKIDPEQMVHRTREVHVHIRKHVQEIFDEEKSFYMEVKKRIDIYSKKIKDLATLLDTVPVEHDGPLVVREQKLREELDNLTKLKYDRIKAFKEMRDAEEEYCRVLGMERHQFPPNVGVPTVGSLREFEQQLIMLKSEKEKRLQKLLKFKSELTTIAEETELPLESDILSGQDTLSLSNETFRQIEEIVRKTRERKLEMEAEKSQLMSKLKVLWKRLKVDDKQTQDFLAKHTDCRVSTLHSIKEELERCEIIKMENTQQFIMSLRQELEQLWEECYVSSGERQLFWPFLSTEMTDDILAAHESEVEKWKAYRENVQHILTKIQKRQKLWDLMAVFEAKASDPNRFKNRKGNLLQEERERKKLQKDLPALENDIFLDIAQYEEENDSFLYHGVNFKKYIEDQWTERINQKENEKLERQNKHLLPGNVKTPTNTPCKRPLTTTPKTAPSKMLKSTNGATASMRTPISVGYKIIPNTVGRSIFSKATKLSPRPNTIKMKDSKMVLRERNQPGQAGGSDSTTYTDFASELNKTARVQCRSSVLHTKKPGGTRTSINSQKKSLSKSSRKSIKNTSKTTPSLTPARGKLGLPFLI